MSSFVSSPIAAAALAATATSSAGIGPADVATIASAVIALGSMIIAVWQGRVARRAAITANDAVVTARDQADSARRSAEAAEKQVTSAEAATQAEQLSHAAQLTVEMATGNGQVAITNGAAVPMFEVSLIRVDGPAISPLKPYGLGSSEHPIDVLTPGGRVIVHVSLQRYGDSAFPNPNAGTYTPVIKFRDQLGNQWLRSGNAAPRPFEKMGE